MKEFWALWRLNYLLVRRNRLIEVSVVVTGLYLLVFHWLRELAWIDKLLVLLIFNDPALMGLLFVGVMVLLERDEGVMGALGVLPMRKAMYIWVRTLFLLLIGVAGSVAMAVMVRGWDCEYLHFLAASVLTGLFFSFFGFVVAAKVRDFNNYMLRAVGAILLLSVPFLGYFGVGMREWYMIFPTQAAIDLYRISLGEEVEWGIILYGYGYLSIWVSVSYIWALRVFKME